jgi:hypothetical protein
MTTHASSQTPAISNPPSQSSSQPLVKTPSLPTTFGPKMGDPDMDLGDQELAQTLE